MELVVVRPCALGFGVFAATAVPRGALLFTFSGRMIGLAETIACGEREGDALQVGPEEYLALDAPGRFINHSCDPNAGVRDDLRCVALTPIQEGEEIRFDYSTTMDEKRWTLRCACSEPSCRGVIGDFRDLPPAIQRRYVDLGVVPRFVLKSTQLSESCDSSHCIRARKPQ